MVSFPLFFAEVGIAFAFQNSTLEAKIILFLLLIGSIFSWSIMWTKISYILQARKQNTAFLHGLHRAKTPLALYTERAHFAPSPLAAVYHAGAKELALHLVGSTDLDETFAARLSTAGSLDKSVMETVRSAMERATGEELLKLESQLILLATAVSGAPFIGLLGTVWGVMDAFSGIATAGHASLSAMAPGVSGSLITTVVALCVAIPAMFGYNYLVSTIRSMTIEMENVTAESIALFERKYLRART